MVRVVGVFIKQ